MPDIKLAGQDTEIRLSKDGEKVLTVRDIASFNYRLRITRTEEEYLGRSGISLDEFAQGAQGSITMHSDDPDTLSFLMEIYDRALNRSAGIVVNIRSAFTFPDGSVRLMQFSDVAFSDEATDVGGRTQHVSFTLDWATGTRPQLISI